MKDSSDPICIARRLPGLGDRPDYARAIYPDPPSHDFCVWLVIAELMRRYHNAPPPLKVKFGLINGQLGAYEFGRNSLAKGGNPCGLSRAYSDQMMANVLRPAIAMMGAVEEAEEHAPFDVVALERWVEYDYHIRDLVDAGRQGYEIPKWQPPQWAHDEVEDYLGDSRPVVITLREVGGNDPNSQPERNSQFNEWMKFAHSIEDDHPILVLRDTCKAEEYLRFFRTWPRASQNAYVRAALYQHALVNMMVCNGPNTWVIFSDAPYLIFKQLIPALPAWDHGQPHGWRDQDHMDVGDQYAWASPQQRMTWTDDTFDNIRSAFDAFLAQRSP